MQMDNTEGKSHNTIPYMIVNLDYHDAVYIKKDTLVAYICHMWGVRPHKSINSA